MSSNFQRSRHRLSMREKSIEKERINKEHNSNFRAGYVHVFEDHLHKTGLRGRKRYFFYALLILMFLAACANLIITILIFSVLRIGHTGMESMVFLPSGLVRFMQDSDMGAMYPSDSQIGGYKAQGLELYGENGQQVILTHSKETSSVSIDHTGTVLMADEGFHVVDPRTNITFFNGKIEEIELQSEVRVFNVKEALTSRITSSLEEDLLITSDSALVRGNEGVNIGGNYILFTASEDIVFKSNKEAEEGTSEEGSTYFFGNIKADKLPKSTDSSQPPAYKLCVCRTNYRVFGVLANFNCDLQVDPIENPC